ncbi:MAG: hypothetical protein PHP82_04005, partial [Candidatus ainarchaeum sp.]|nr:hypothetical protein [Candidatus ainarchaeum sp.]
ITSTYFLDNYNTNIVITSSQCNRINAFYFNDFSQTINNENNFCDIIITYNKDSKDFSENTFCEGFK